jgi:ABC-2 type transport system ATP-binding protein
VLEETAFHPGRTARNHLRVLARAGGHAPQRVDEVLTQIGLAEFADQHVKGYSLGMRQRLAIAAALLGDPQVLILDEPANGLDPPGISAMRRLLRDEAARGRAVLVSSHLLAEVAQSVDDVVVISRGRLKAAGPLQEVLGGGGGEVAAEVRARDVAALAAALDRSGLRAHSSGDGLVVPGASTEQVGEVAAREGIVLTHLVARTRSLEDAFLALTGEGGAP